MTDRLQPASRPRLRPLTPRSSRSQSTDVLQSLLPSRTTTLELLSFLRRATRNDEAAEDLAQEAFLRLAREVEAGRTPEHIRAWLYRVASNLVVSRARRAHTVVAWLTRHGPTAAEDDREPSPEEGLIRRERRSELEALLDTLPADARTALLLSGQGFTGLEIAAAIGRSHAATRTLLTRTRINLRLALEAKEGPR